MVDMGEPPLIVGPHRICSSELMGLLLKGVASGNFGAQNATNTAGNDWPPALGNLVTPFIYIEQPTDFKS